MLDRLLQKTAGFFRLNDAGWERHANPLSVYSRIATWPLLVVTLWSFHWIGWAALPFLLLLAAWTFINPRIFPPPASTRSWASRAVLGERIYLARATVPVPREHAVAANLLAAGGMAAMLVMIGGLLLAQPALYLAGAVAAFLMKMWFVDRMVWLFNDMRRIHKDYAGWLR